MIEVARLALAKVDADALAAGVMLVDMLALVVAADWASAAGVTSVVSASATVTAHETTASNVAGVPPARTTKATVSGGPGPGPSALKSLAAMA